MNNPLIFCFTVAICWAGSSFLGRASELNPWMIACFIIIAGLIPIFPIACQQSFSLISTKAWVYGISAGVINTIGLIAWYYLVSGANNGLWNLSSVLSISIVLLTIFLAIGNKVLFNDLLTIKHMLGLVLACLAIWLLK